MNENTTTVSFWNVPNILTLLRIVAIPFVAMMLWEEPTPSECIFACILFAIAMITDVIDGNTMTDDTDADKQSAVDRNVEHLELMVAKDDWGSESMTAVNAAIVAGKAYTA